MYLLMWLDTWHALRLALTWKLSLHDFKPIELLVAEAHWLLKLGPRLTKSNLEC